MNNSLQELTEIAKILEDTLIANNGEITEELEKQLELSKVSIESKIDGYHQAMKRFEQMGEVYKSEAEKFVKASKVYKAVAERIKERLKDFMMNEYLDTLYGQSVRFVLTKNADTFEVDERFLSEEFFIIEQVKKVDRKKIKETIETCKIPSGVNIVQVTSLRSYPYKAIKGES